MRIRSWWSFALLLLCSPVFAEPARLVKDINPGVELPLVDPSQSPSVFSFYTPVNGRVVFMALFRDDSVFPQEIQCGLWVTDGTAGGTEKLAELCVGVGRYEGRNVMLATTGAVAFFTDAQGHLWRTDGTAAGTFKLSNVEFQLVPGGGSRTIVQDGTLLFMGCTPVRGCELWRSDGTREGTRIVRDLAPGRRSSFPGQFVLSPQHGVLFLADGALWLSDGTAAGTAELFRSRGPLGDVVVQGASVYLTTFVAPDVQLWVVDLNTRKRRLVRSFTAPARGLGIRLDAVGGRVLIVQFDEEGPVSALWETDGTRGGTRPLGPPFRFWALVDAESLGSRAVFAARREPSPSNRLGLWVLDPSRKRPRQITGCPGGCPQVDASTLFTPYKGRLFFGGWDAAHGQELWETDGTAQGTRLVKDLCPGPCDGTPLGFRVVLDHLVFGDAHKNLWVSDGTPAGTIRLAEVPLVDAFRDVAPLGGDRIIFTGVDLGFGPQPTVSFLTPASTSFIRPLGSGIARGSSILSLTPLGGKSVFTACNLTAGGLWVSDGTEAGTFELPLEPESCDLGRLFRFLAPAANLVFFHWKGKLWRTDGTPAGTVELLDLASYVPPLIHATELNGKLLFILVPHSPPGPGPVYEFWTSDGTPQGTQKVFQKIFTGSTFRLEAVGDEAFFIAQETTPGAPPNQLWRTDGTEAGTRPLLNSFSAALLDFEAVRLNGKTWFLGASASRQGFAELWGTDGTAVGTQPVIPDLAFPRPVRPRELTVFKGDLYFFNDQGVPGAPVGLWRSDGTAAGTRLVRAIDPYRDPTGIPQRPTELTVAGDYLFFRADDGVHGTELWRSDGTTEGTALVRDIAPGPATARVSGLMAAGGKLYFAATDVDHGLELWESDGTAAGTRLVDDIHPGPDSSVPAQLTAADGKLFFTANDGEHGRELWVVPVP